MCLRACLQVKFLAKRGSSQAKRQGDKLKIMALVTRRAYLAVNANCEH